MVLLPALPLVFWCYHFGYGYGFLRGLWDFVLFRRRPGDTFTALTRVARDHARCRTAVGADPRVRFAGVVAATAPVTGLFWLVLPAAYRADEGSDHQTFYEPVARNLLAGRGAVREDGAAATRYPPGYPLVLAGLLGLAALLHLPESVVQASFLLVGNGIIAGLVYCLAGRVWGRGAWVAPLAWGTCPLALWMTKQPGSELPFLIVLLGAVILFQDALTRERWGGLRPWPLAAWWGSPC